VRARVMPSGSGIGRTMASFCPTGVIYPDR